MGIDFKEIQEKVSTGLRPWQRSFEFWARAVDIYAGYKVLFSFSTTIDEVKFLFCVVFWCLIMFTWPMMSNLTSYLVSRCYLFVGVLCFLGCVSQCVKKVNYIAFNFQVPDNWLLIASKLGTVELWLFRAQISIFRCTF